MYNIVVFDDEPEQGGLIADIVNKCSVPIKSMIPVSKKEELMRLIEEGKKIDILITDIYLEGSKDNGIDLVKKIMLKECGIQIIYITGFIEYCEDVYKTEHVYFLKKPVSQKRLDEALQRAVKRLEEYKKATIAIYRKGSVINAPIHDIRYIESDRRKLKYVLGNAEYDAYGKLSDVEKQLSEEFVRCHKSYLVNMRYIREFDENKLILDNDAVISVSRSYHERTKNTLFKYLSM